MKWIDVINKVKHREYSREVRAIKVNVYWETTTIAEILLSQRNLMYYLNTTKQIFIIGLNKASAGLKNNN